MTGRIAQIWLTSKKQRGGLRLASHMCVLRASCAFSMSSWPVDKQNASWLAEQAGTRKRTNALNAPRAFLCLAGFLQQHALRPR